MFPSVPTTQLNRHEQIIVSSPSSLSWLLHLTFPSVLIWLCLKWGNTFRVECAFETDFNQTHQFKPTQYDDEQHVVFDFYAELQEDVDRLRNAKIMTLVLRFHLVTLSVYSIIRITIGL